MASYKRRHEEITGSLITRLSSEEIEKIESAAVAQVKIAVNDLALTAQVAPANRAEKYKAMALALLKSIKEVENER